MKKQEMAPQGADAAVAKPDFSLIDENLLKSRIYTIRGVKVMLDADLAEIYGYETKAFNRQVKNNNERFPEEFKDAGNKITTIVQLDDIEGYRPMFEELWAQKTPLKIRRSILCLNRLFYIFPHEEVPVHVCAGVPAGRL